VRRSVAAFLLAASLSAAATEPPDQQRLFAEAVSLGLAAQPTWLRLLHYKSVDSQEISLIRSPEFFLSENGQSSASAELNATMAAFLSPPGDDANEHAQCRFPARFLWLSTKLEFPGPTLHCSRLERWAKFDQLDSISLMMISGYFGNPASTFGHILMKINNGSVPTKHSLLDMGINYGALVPPNEATITYVMRGLFGGYEAGFSDQDYYRYDLTYSRTEFRDMWEYELRFTDYQKRMILYHLWEVSGKKFRYYFLKENCAYRLAELLELVTGEDFVSDVSFWYAPISVFHRLRRIDATSEPGDRLIASVRFIPSAQRVLYAQLDDVAPADIRALNKVLTHDGDLSLLDELPPERQASVIDTLLSYYQYQLAGQAEDEALELRRARDEAIRRRLEFPAAVEEIEVVIPERRPPSLGAAPSYFGIGGGYDEVSGDYALLNYSPFNYDGIGNNELERSSLIVFDLSVAYDATNNLRLHSLDIVRARKINLNTVRVGSESRRSWEIALGMRQELNGCGKCNEVFFTGSVGRSVALSANVTGTALLGATLADGEFGSSFDSGVAVIFGAGNRWASELGIKYRYSPSRDESRVVTSLAGRLSLAQQHELRFEVSDNQGIGGGLFYAYHW